MTTAHNNKKKRDFNCANNFSLVVLHIKVFYYEQEFSLSRPRLLRIIKFLQDVLSPCGENLNYNY